MEKTLREKISCTVGTKNAENDIRDCLEAVKWADEIIVIDDFSTDRTVEIARQYTDKVFQKKMVGDPEQRDFAIRQASHRWILSLDADERVSPQLRDEILEKLSHPAGFSGFYMRRLNIFLGRPVRHCGWYEVNNTRFFNKEKAKYDITLKYCMRMERSGPMGALKNDLLHYTCRNLQDYFNRVNIWSTLNTKDLIAKGKRVTCLNSPYYLILKPAAVFFYKYFFKSGYLDGFEGFLICAISAITYFISYAKLWESQNVARDKR